MVVVLCGVCRGPSGSWAVVALAGHPGGFVRHAVLAPATGDAEGFGASAGAALRGTGRSLRARLADDAWVELRLEPRVRWPRRALGALGPAQLLPGLPQYWHPVLPVAAAWGEVGLGGERLHLDGAPAYAEKNWGPDFPVDWWWGHAAAFDDPGVSVAFAGGPLAVAGHAVAPTFVVVRLGGEILSLAPPLASVRAGTAPDAWRVRARSARHCVEVEGDGDGRPPHLLPVPDPATGRVTMRSAQHLAGRIRLRVRRGGRTLFEGESPLAGLERGIPADRVPAPDPS